MDTNRIERLSRLIKSSLILLPVEREKWLARVPAMQEKDLLELEDILVNSMKIDWQNVLPTYQKSLPQIAEASPRALTRLT